MDGFFVAKFKVTKRAKQAKQDNVERNDIVMDEEVALEDVQFDEGEDEEYLRGKWICIAVLMPGSHFQQRPNGGD